MSSIIRQSEIEIIVSKCVEATVLAIHNRKGDDAILHGLEAGLRDVVREELSKAGLKVQRKRKAIVKSPSAGHRSWSSRPADRKSCLSTVKNYLPSNFTAYESSGTIWGDVIEIEGYDRAGWTLSEYVIPRLASGLIVAREVDAEENEQ